MLFSISDSKMVMQNNLKQMTSLVMKLDQKVKREVNSAKEESERMRREKYYKVKEEETQEEEREVEQTPLQK